MASDDNYGFNSFSKLRYCDTNLQTFLQFTMCNYFIVCYIYVELHSKFILFLDRQ